MKLFGTGAVNTPPPSQGVGEDANRKKILIVDDNAVILAALSGKLKANGYATLTASDGAMAISMVRRTAPDLILLDISYPIDASSGGISWDGFTIIEWLGRMDKGKHIPIIVISGGDEAIYKERSLRAGAIAFFKKPVNNDELINVIRQTIGDSPK